MPEVSGSLPLSLQVESLACSISTRRARRHKMWNKEGAWRTWFGSQKLWLLGSPVRNLRKQTLVSALRLPVWNPNECQTHFTAKCKTAQKICIEILGLS